MQALNALLWWGLDLKQREFIHSSLWLRQILDLRKTWTWKFILLRSYVWLWQKARNDQWLGDYRRLPQFSSHPVSSRCLHQNKSCFLFCLIFFSSTSRSSERMHKGSNSSHVHLSSGKSEGKRVFIEIQVPFLYRNKLGRPREYISLWETDTKFPCLSSSNWGWQDLRQLVVSTGYLIYCDESSTMRASWEPVQ